jgi:hypothetical protein
MLPLLQSFSAFCLSKMHDGCKIFFKILSTEAFLEATTAKQSSAGITTSRGSITQGQYQAHSIDIGTDKSSKDNLTLNIFNKRNWSQVFYIC